MRCGAPTARGTACRWPANECQFEHHRRWRQQHGRSSATEPEPSPAEPGASKAALDGLPPEIIAGRDLAGLGWWVVRAMAEGSLEERTASVLASLMRVLAAVGGGEAAGEDVLREVVLRGLVMHGVPPRTEDEWELARAIFDDGALAEIRRWAPLVEADGDDDLQPFRLGEGRAVEVEMPLLIEDEDAV